MADGFDQRGMGLAEKTGSPFAGCRRVAGEVQLRGRRWGIAGRARSDDLGEEFGSCAGVCGTNPTKRTYGGDGSGFSGCRLPI